VGRERTTSPITLTPDGGRPASRSLTSLLTAVALTIPAIVLRFSDASLANVVEALLFGLAIVGAAFILSWAAEVAQIEEVACPLIHRGPLPGRAVKVDPLRGP